MILDTSSVIRRVSQGREIEENITSITLVEYPPVRSYNELLLTQVRSFQRSPRASCLQAHLLVRGAHDSPISWILVL